jgi:predicted peptidase
MLNHKTVCKTIPVIMLLLLVITSAAFTSSAANLGESMLALSFTDSKGTVLPYRLYVPDDYSEEREYPLLLFLHGAGERGSDNYSQIANNVRIIERIVDSSDSEHDCIVVAPQCATNHQWVDTPWGDGSYNQDQIPISKYLAATVELLEDIQNEYSIDENRLYVTGLSMGGYGAWDIITRYPNMFAAALPVCGAGDPSKAELIKDMAIWAFHGALDDIVPVEGSREMVAALENCGSNVIYTEYENVNHFCWHNAYAEPDLLSWLFEQSSENMPDELPETSATLNTTETSDVNPSQTTSGLKSETPDENTTGSTEGSGAPKTGAGSFAAVLSAAVVALMIIVFSRILKKREA